MEATSQLPGQTLADYARRVDWNGVSIWLLGFGLIVYLGLKSGGYDPLVHDQVGIAVWWIVLAGTVVGAMPGRRPGALGWCGLGLLAAFVLWTGLSLAWTESNDLTSADLASVAGYLGVLGLAMFVSDSSGGRRLIAALGTGVAFLCAIALLSRMHPAWFPQASETARFLTDSKNRLSYPLDYWNALGALAAIGLPLMLALATSARTTMVRALAAAALPAISLTVFLTISRAGTAAAIVGLCLFFVLTSDRLPKLLTAIVGGVGGAILMDAVAQRQALHDGLLTPLAERQGNEVLAMTLVVCAGVGLIQAGISLALAHDMRPGWTHLSRRQTQGICAAGALVAIVLAAGLGAPHRVSTAWSDFKSENGPGEGVGRLGSAAGESRYQFWSSAVRENQSKPLAGTGSGTFQYWWTRDGSNKDVVRDAHSLYLQTLGELGIVGLLLLAGFLLTTIVGGARRALGAASSLRPSLAAAVAGCVAFSISAAFDWTWQVPVLVAVLLLLAAVALDGRPDPVEDEGSRRSPPLLRAAICLAALAAIVAIAIPLSSSTLIRQSQAAARNNDLSGALRDARTAQNVQPDAAEPHLQQALILEGEGLLRPAAEEARAATESGSTNWQSWMIRSRIDAELGRARAALRDYREAKALNPHSDYFAPH